MKTLNRSVAHVGLTLFIVLTGCVKLWQESIDIRTFMVEVNRPGEPIAKPLAKKLWIEPVTVLPPSNVRNLIARESDVEYSTSYYTELLMSPSENFRNEIFVWLAASGMFEEVSIVDRQGRSHSLLATVLEFHADKMAKAAVLNVKVTLLNEQARGNRVVFSKDYRESVPLEESSVEVLIRTYNTGLASLLTHLEADLANALD